MIYFNHKNPLSMNMICTKFGEIWPNGFIEVVKNVKSLPTDRQTDVVKQGIRKLT